MRIKAKPQASQAELGLGLSLATISNVINECNTDAAKYLKDEPDVFRKNVCA